MIILVNHYVIRLCFLIWLIKTIITLISNNYTQFSQWIKCLMHDMYNVWIKLFSVYSKYLHIPAEKNPSQIF